MTFGRQSGGSTRSVLDIYATSVDYKPDAKLSQEFFATVQNKVHWATHGHRRPKLCSSAPIRASQSTRPGRIVRRNDATIAKNYLTTAELEVLNRIVSLYLEYAELQALERKPMTMRAWVAKLDEFLKISGRKLLDHAGSISAETARMKAEAEYERYIRERDTDPRAIDAEFEKVARRLPAMRGARGAKKRKS